MRYRSFWRSLGLGVAALAFACSSSTEPQVLQHRCDHGPIAVPKTSDSPYGTLQQPLISCTERKDTGYVRGKSFGITVVTVDGKPVEKDTANAYWVMREAARKAGVHIKVVSGFRTMSQQQYLYNCYLTKKCNNGNLAARPGYSNHQSGHALDLNTSSSGVYNWLSAHGGKYGFKRTVPSEKWHWEWWGGGPGGGPCKPKTCKAECTSKSKLRKADCSTGDCAAFGALCTKDKLGLRCYSVFCPPLGSKKVCVKGELGTCKDGTLKLSKCPANQACVDTPSARCAGVRGPQGYLDSVSCTGLKGWAQDPDNKDKAIQVKLAFGGKHGEKGAIEVTLTADQHRDDLCKTIGSCKHGFSHRVPMSLLDGKSYPVHALAIDADGVKNAALSRSPGELRCQIDIPAGVRRHVTSPSSFAAWKWSYAWDVLTLPDAKVAAVPQGRDLPETPQLAKSDSSKTIWVIDGTWRRGLTGPQVMARWGWKSSDVQSWTDAQLDGYRKGSPWPERPFLIKDSEGAVYLLDARQGDPPAPEPSATEPSATEPSAEPPASTPDAGPQNPGPEPSTAPDQPGSTPPPTTLHPDEDGVLNLNPNPGPRQGCQGCTSSPTQPGQLPLAGLLLLALLGLSRRKT